MKLEKKIKNSLIQFMLKTYKHTQVHAYETYKNTDTQTHSYTTTQIHSYTTTQTHTHTATQTHRHTNRIFIEN